VYLQIHFSITDKSEKKEATNRTSQPKKEQPTFQPKEEKASTDSSSTPMSPLSTKIVPATQIQFSMKEGKKVSLGTGGFAKVYAAKWHGTEVRFLFPYGSFVP
jgi:hypothetical protein